jgi:hypothetical protein
VTLVKKNSLSDTRAERLDFLRVRHSKLICSLDELSEALIDLQAEADAEDEE